MAGRLVVPPTSDDSALPRLELVLCRRSSARAIEVAVLVDNCARSLINFGLEGQLTVDFLLF